MVEPKTKKTTTKGKPSTVKPRPGEEAPPKKIVQSEQKAKTPKVKPQLIHHVIRAISRDGSGSGGAWTMQEIEEHIMTYLAGGWRVHQTHYLGELPEGYTMLWVLLKN